MKALKAAAVFTSSVATAFYFSALFSVLSSPWPVIMLRNFIISSVFLCVLPVSYVIHLLLIGKVDLDMTKKETRQTFYSLSVLSCLAGCLVFLIYADHFMFFLCFSYTCVTFLNSVINRKWKISAHTSGITGPLTALTFLFGASVLPYHILVLPVMWLRIRMKKHTPAQVIAGSLLSAFATYSVYFFFW